MAFGVFSVSLKKDGNPDSLYSHIMPQTSHKIPDLKSMIQQLIATPSISSVSPAFDQSNLDVIHLLADWCESLGFHVEIQHLQNHKANLIATHGRGEGGLILSGHTDTVPFDEGKWHSDPFRVTEQDNRYYGLGTADMKSFLALALEAIQRTDLEQLTP